MLDGARLTAHDLVIDPACGDGSFLRGAVATLARAGVGANGSARAAAWAERLVGFDVDPAAVQAARLGLAAAFREHLGVVVPETEFRIYAADALGHASLTALLQSVGLAAPGPAQRLLVVGNPPYVEAKRLPRETKQALKAAYPAALVGAPDLYLYFLHACLDWLRTGDTLAFVLPNKLLVNTNARAVRERLLQQRALRALWFATQTRVFGDAAVYPIVLFAQGAPGGDDAVDAVTLARDGAGQLAAGECVRVAGKEYRRTQSRAIFPPPTAPVLRGALSKLLALSERLDTVLDVRWTISFHRAGLRERYVLPSRPDEPCARPFLGGGSFSGNGEVTRYSVAWAGWWIRYAAAELQAEQNALPEIALFEQPKIIICQNGRTLRAAYDDQGFVLKDTFLCGLLRDVAHPLVRHPRALVGLLCSRAVHFFYSHVFYGGHVNGGYLHFLRSFLVDIPLGAWTDAAAEEVSGLVQRRETAAVGEWEAFEEQIEARVAAALGTAGDEQRAIAEWASGDANWSARERVRGPVELRGKSEG